MPLETIRRFRTSDYHKRGELPAPPQLPAAGWLHAPFHTQTKLGLGHLKELPVKTTWPVEQLNWKTAQSSESWLATISHWPLLSNWKWRGVSPRVWKMPASVTRPAGVESRWMRCTATESWPRLEVSTKSPLGWIATRPHVLSSRGNAEGSVETVCTRLRVGLHERSSSARSCGAVRANMLSISEATSGWYWKTATCEESSLTT
mmetsp:Transcript_80600/g.195395  ORF Transcript_80600/g.195395 Transcript_80600/m.195395 type:complete len:204 (+) Transcript_80600:50-661(+)